LDQARLDKFPAKQDLAAYLILDRHHPVRDHGHLFNRTTRQFP